MYELYHTFPNSLKLSQFFHMIQILSNFSFLPKNFGGVVDMWHGTDDDDIPGIEDIQTDMMKKDDVDNTLIPTGVAHTTGIKDEQFSAMDNNAEALPSIESGLYSVIITSKNFTDSTNTSVLSVPTANIYHVSGGAAKPGLMKEEESQG